MVGLSWWDKSVCLIYIFCLLICCSPKQDEVKAGLFSLEKVIIIDTENSKTAEMGLTDINHFDIDSEGNIFISNLKSEENYVFILDKDGSLVSVFGRKGQGPGEFQFPRELVVSNQDEIFITDQGKVVVFNNAGRFMREFHINDDYQKVIPLDKDRYLAVAVKLNQDLSQSFEVILCSYESGELKTLDSSKIGSFKKAVKVNIIPTIVYWEKSKDLIYTGNTDEYKIRVFDFEGQLLRTIIKDYDAVFLSDEDKKEYEQRLQKYPPEIKESFFIPDTFPPFRAIVSLGDKWLLIQTYEESNEGNYLYDIFDTRGEFLGKTEFEGYQVKLKGSNAYCLKQKDSGYKELVVYRMIWVY